MRIAEEEGLILRAMGDTLAFCPPLIISPEEIDDLFDRTADDLIPECSGTMGAAAALAAIMEGECRVLTF